MRRRRDWSVDDFDAMEVRRDKSTKFDGAGVYSPRHAVAAWRTHRHTHTDAEVSGGEGNTECFKIREPDRHQNLIGLSLGHASPSK